MKKFIPVLSLVTLLGFVSPVYAQGGTTINVCGSSGPFKALCEASGSSFGSILGVVLQLIFVISIIAATLYLIWGGFKWLTSGGDKQAVTTAREHIIAAIVGLVIIFLSYFVINILLAVFLNGVTLNNLSLPSIF